MGTYTPEFLLSLLPPIMKDLDIDGDLYDFLSIFVDMLNEYEAKIEAMTTFYNPDKAPSAVLDALAQSLGVIFNKNFSEQQLRSAIGGAVHWYRKKGTIASLEELIGSLGYISFITEYKLDPLDRPYSIIINGGGSPVVTGVGLDYPTGVYTTYTLLFDFSAMTLTWGGGLPVDISAGGVFVLMASDGSSTIRATVNTASLPAGDEIDSVQIVALAPPYFTDTSDYDLDTLMDNLTGWLPIGTNALSLTYVPVEVKVGTSAIKFNKNTDFAYTGIARDFAGFILKDLDVSRMRCEWWVYIPSMTNVTGVTLRLSNTTYSVNDDYLEWKVTTDVNGIPLQTGWNKIMVNLLSAPTSVSGTFVMTDAMRSLSVLVNTQASGNTLTGVILDGLRFYSAGVQSPLFDILFTNKPGVSIDPVIVGFLKDEIVTNKPVYEILNRFSYLLGITTYIDFVASLTRDLTMHLDYFPTLVSDQDLPPAISLPEVIHSDIGLMSDCKSFYSELIISTT